jgi:hypothetical protein
MGLSAFGYAVLVILLGAPVAALTAIVSAAGHKRFFLADLGTLLLPPLVFIIAGLARPQIHLGWAMFFWPLMIVVTCMYAYAVKVWAVKRYPDRAVIISRILFGLTTSIALVLGITVPPIYE